LGEGELTKAFTIKADGVSKSALEKIQKAGGKVEIVAPKRTTKARNKKKSVVSSTERS
jgi:large subunit ribosomal protein L15